MNPSSLSTPVTAPQRRPYGRLLLVIPLLLAAGCATPAQRSPEAAPPSSATPTESHQGTSSGAPSTSGDPTLCGAEEARLLECIEAPDASREQVMACNDVEKNYFQCGQNRRRALSVSRRDELSQVHLRFLKQKLSAYQRALEKCEKSSKPCDPDKLRVIQKQLKGLPREISKTEKLSSTTKSSTPAQ
jgi:hypothetical protein